MLGHAGAQEIVHAEERVDEVHAVQAVHDVVPRAADGEEDGHAGQPLHVQELPRPAPHAEEDEQDEARQQEAYGPLRQDGQPRKEKGREVEPSPTAAVSEVEGNEHGVEEKDERHVRDDGLREVEEGNRRAEDDGREESRSPVVELAREVVRLKHIEHREHSREKARSKLSRAENLESREEFPVKEDRFIIPVIPVDARRGEVASCQHLLGGQRVVRFDGVRDGQLAVAEQDEDNDGE